VRKLGLGIALIAIGIMVAPQVSAQEMTPITNPIPARTWIIEPNGNVPNLADLVAAAGGTLHRVHNEINIAVAISDDPDFGTRLEAATKIRSATRDARVPWGPQGLPWGVRTMELPGSGIEANPAGAFFFPCQWNMTQIGAPGAWSQGEFGHPDVKVAVLDTGVDPDHLDLAGHVDTAQSVSMLTPGSGCNAFDEASFRDLHWHGSFVSGLIAGNGLGMAAVAPDATIVGVKVLACDNFGSFADIIAGILYAASLPDVDVINMSLQGGFPKSLGIGTLVGAFNFAVNYAKDQGKLVVSGAGNYGVNMDKDRDFHWVPAQAGSGISAWAGDIDGNLASYSNFGRTGTWVGAGGGDVFGGAAIPLPGCWMIPPFLQDGIVSVCSTTSIVVPGCQTSNSFYLLGNTGTSFSCPLVSGVAALVDGKNGGALDGGDLKTILSNTADDIGKKGVDALFSHGRVNANEAVK
jgi:subtilisin family serine protease